MYDCPAWNWIEFTDSGDPSFLIKEGGSATIEELEAATGKIRDELFNKFGFPEDLDEYLNELLQVELFRCEWILSDNDSIRRQKEMWMEIHQKKADSVINSNNDFNTEDAVIGVEKYLGREVDLRNISIYKFRSYLRALSNGKKNN